MVPASSIRFTLGATEDPLAVHLFRAALLQENLTATVNRRWSVASAELERLPPHELLLDDGGRYALLRMDDSIVRVAFRKGEVVCVAGARGREAANRALDRVQEAWPKTEPEPLRTSRVTFWNWANGYASSRVRDVETPPWDEVRPNYATATADGLADLFARDTPPESGRLVLWHGPPGTGKTHLIRALAHAWRDWCATEYVIDIDELLNGSSEYLTSLLLDGTPDPRPASDDPWRLLVLEDAGEFLMPDAPATQGQGFSRLLNTLDGMLGQTAKVMVLATTNRPLSALDPSIVWPGRCGLALEIPPLPAGEAASWLAARDHAAPVGTEATLAELFGVLRGDPPPAPRRPVGFVA